MTNTIKVNLALLCAVILWSSAFVAIRMSLEGYSPGSVGLLRFLLASFCFSIPIIFRKRLKGLTVHQIISLIIIGTVGTAAYSILLNSGEKSISPGMASFIVAQTPIINACFALIFLRERPSLNSLFAITISCIGVTIIVMGQPLEENFNLGLMLVIMATICGSIQSIMQKYLLAKLSPLHVTALSTWFAAISLMVFAPQASQEIQQAPMSAHLAVLFLGLIPSTLGQWLWGYGLSKTSVVKASTYLYMMPFLSTLFAWIMLDVWPSQLELIGGIVALVGVIIIKKNIKTSKSTDLNKALPTQ